MKTDTLSSDRAIQVILKQFHEIEKKWDNGVQRSRMLLKLRNLLAALDSREDLDIPFITRIHHHLDETISLEQLWNLMVPVEREHSRTNITDEDFMVTTEDSDTCSRMPASVVLDNIRSSFNVGGIFRTADCAGFENVHLCGYSASPENPKVRKSSMDSHGTVPWETHRDIAELAASLKNQNIQLIALETVPSAPAIERAEIDFPCAVLLGNERFGLSSSLLSLVDLTVRIPMYGRKNSLNVVSAFSVCAFEVRKKWENSKHSS